MPRVKSALAIELAKDCKTIEDVHEKLKDLFKDTIQQIFEAEMDHHLGYLKNDPEGNNTGNSRNGYSNKTVKTRVGETELELPRDRNSEFEPQVIRKYQTTANELEDRIMAMYAKGLSTRDIEDQMKDIYGIKGILGDTVPNNPRQNLGWRSGCSSALPYPPGRVRAGNSIYKIIGTKPLTQKYVHTRLFSG